MKCVGEQCTGTDQCRGDNVECTGVWPPICGCPSDRYFETGTGNCVSSMFCFDSQIDRKSLSLSIYIYTEPRKKLTLCLSADIHKYENRDQPRFICLEIERVFYFDFVLKKSLVRVYPKVVK